MPAHGDWQRNWLHHRGVVRVIDFGRAAWRPAESDLARLAVQQLSGRPDLQEALVGGYGSDPRDRIRDGCHRGMEYSVRHGSAGLARKGERNG